MNNPLRGGFKLAALARPRLAAALALACCACITNPPFSPGDGGSLDGGQCNNSGVVCMMQVCPAGSNCSGSGVHSATYECAASTARQVSTFGYSFAVYNCADGGTEEPAWPFMFNSMPEAGTYHAADPAVLYSDLVCYPGEDAVVNRGAYWGIGHQNDGGTLGQFTLTLSSVTQSGVISGNPVYSVHGSFQGQCVAWPGTLAAGTVAISATF